MLITITTINSSGCVKWKTPLFWLPYQLPLLVIFGGGLSQQTWGNVIVHKCLWCWMRMGRTTTIVWYHESLRWPNLIFSCRQVVVSPRFGVGVLSAGSSTPGQAVRRDSANKSSATDLPKPGHCVPNPASRRILLSLPLSSAHYYTPHYRPIIQ